jgi:hypothetical protein
MRHFRNDDFVYYALKGKPISKKPKHSKKNLLKVINYPPTCEPNHSLVSETGRILKEVNLVNCSSLSPISTTSAKINKLSSQFQSRLIEMQKAV